MSLRLEEYMMRICYHEIHPESFCPVGLRAALEKLLNEAKRPNTEVEVRFPHKYFGGTGVGSNGFNVDYIECIKQAEAEGFDAIVLGCFADPGLQEAKRVCGIPIVGPAESTMFWANMLGAKYAIAAFPAPGTRNLMERLIDRYGFRAKAIWNPVRFAAYPERDLWKIGAGMDATPMVESFAQVSRQAVEDGAEVIILGCTCTSLIHQRLVQAIEEVGAPVLSPPQAGLKTAEVLVDFKRNMGFYISRVGTFFQES
jgi:allantoin racemase